MAIELNPSLDPNALAAEYREKRRMQIRGFLTEPSARTVHDDLHELPWGLVYNEGPQVVQLAPDRVAQLDARQASDIMSGIHQRARSEYQFLYAYFPLLTAYFSPSSPRFRVFDFYEFINSPGTLDFIRKVRLEAVPDEVGAVSRDAVVAALPRVDRV